MRRLRQRCKDVADAVPPAALLAGLREHVAHGLPEPERAVADGEHWCLHAASFARAQQVRPGLAGLAEPVGERDELLGPVRADPQNHQQAHLVLLEPDLQMDPVDPDVDVVGAGQRPGVEGALLVLPLRRQPGDGRGRQARAGAEELLQRRTEVIAGQAMQIQQRQDLRDLRRLARPGRQNRRAEPQPLTGRRIDALVVDPRRPHRHRARRRHHLPRRMPAVAHHQPTTLGIQLLGVRVDVGSDLGLRAPFHVTSPRLIHRF